MHRASPFRLRPRAATSSVPWGPHTAAWTPAYRGSSQSGGQFKKHSGEGRATCSRPRTCLLAGKRWAMQRLDWVPSAHSSLVRMHSSLCRAQSSLVACTAACAAHRAAFAACAAASAVCLHTNSSPFRTCAFFFVSSSIITSSCGLDGRGSRQQYLASWSVGRKWQHEGQQQPGRAARPDFANQTQTCLQALGVLNLGVGRLSQQPSVQSNYNTRMSPPDLPPGSWCSQSRCAPPRPAAPPE